jgi:hypothetical protein
MSGKQVKKGSIELAWVARNGAINYEKISSVSPRELLILDLIYALRLIPYSKAKYSESVLQTNLQTCSFRVPAFLINRDLSKDLI